MLRERTFDSRLVTKSSDANISHKLHGFRKGLFRNRDITGGHHPPGEPARRRLACDRRILRRVDATLEECGGVGGKQQQEKRPHIGGQEGERERDGGRIKEARNSGCRVRIVQSAE